MALLYAPPGFMLCDGTLLLKPLEIVRDFLVRLFLLCVYSGFHYAIGLRLKNKTCFMDFQS